MKEGAGPEDVSLGQLGAAAAQIVREVVSTGQPRVVTDAGRAVAVIVASDAFDALSSDAAARGLRHDLELALAEADAGRLVEHDAVLQDLREQFAGRVASDVLAQLGNA